MSVCLKITISVTTEPIGLYSSENILTGPVMVLNYFLRGWDTLVPQPHKKRKKKRKMVVVDNPQPLKKNHSPKFLKIISRGVAASERIKVSHFKLNLI